jgi:hypothetical protein
MLCNQLGNPASSLIHCHTCSILNASEQQVLERLSDCSREAVSLLVLLLLLLLLLLPLRWRPAGP